jgi:AraC-like DNA-binding protein
MREKIATLLPSGDFSQERLACLMNMSVSTLHRRLKAEQTSYRKILDEVRCDLAVYHLNRTTESISEIAYHLGFGDVSNFSHACQRWLNTSPRAYRKKKLKSMLK